MTRSAEAAEAAANGGTPPACLFSPQIRIHGEIQPSLYDEFSRQLDSAQKESDGPIVVELTTLGGDADLSRRICLDIRICREQTGRRMLFFGKTTVYSAGVSIMAAFPREDRYLTRDTVILVHERQMDTSAQLSGPLRGVLDKVRGLLAQIELGIRLENQGFEAVCAGSDIPPDECRQRACSGWYLDAEEAHRRRLVQGLV